MSETDITRWYDPPKPPKSVKDYVVYQQDIRRFRDRTLRAQAFASRYRAVAGPDGLAAVNQGLSLMGTASSIGSFAGPLGTAIAGGIGMMGGLIMGLVPTERAAQRAQWDTLVATMSPIERYGVFAGVREFANRAVRSEGVILEGGAPYDPCGPWRWATDPEWGHTDWGGPVSRTVELLERLFRQPCIPPEVELDTEKNKRSLAFYVLLFCAGAHDNRRTPGAMRAVWPMLSEGRTAPPLTRYFAQWKDTQLGVLRARASSPTSKADTFVFKSIWNPLLTPMMRKVLRESRR